MTEYREHIRHSSSDGELEVTVEQGDHGLCRFIFWRLYDPAPDIPELGGQTWVPSKTSGFYQTIADAEEAALATSTWLKAQVR
jgi:hypothetical protein